MMYSKHLNIWYKAKNRKSKITASRKRNRTPSSHLKGYYNRPINAYNILIENFHECFHTFQNFSFIQNIWPISTINDDHSCEYQVFSWRFFHFSCWGPPQGPHWNLLHDKWPYVKCQQCGCWLKGQIVEKGQTTQGWKVAMTA